MAGSSSRPWHLSLQAWIGLLLLGLTFVFIVAHGRLLLHVGSVLFGAVLLSLAIRPLADKLAERRVPRGLTVLGVYAGLILVLALLAQLLLPMLKDEFTRLQGEGPALLPSAFARLAAVPLVGQFIPSYGALAGSLSTGANGMWRPLAGTVISAAEVLLDLFILLILAYFFVTDVGLGERLLVAWTPSQHRQRLRATVLDLQHRLTRWIWAQAAIALYFAVVFSIGLLLMRVPFALTIGTVGGLLEVIPYLGGAIALVLALLSALTVHTWLAVWVAVFYLVVVELEAHVIAPTFYGRIIGIHPAALLVALLLGGRIYGIAGILFAVPVAVILKVVLEEVRIRWILPQVEGIPGDGIAGPQPAQVEATVEPVIGNQTRRGG